LESIVVVRERRNIDRVRIRQEWRHCSQESLETTAMTVVHRKSEWCVHGSLS
jgi:hypothetical protein